MIASAENRQRRCGRRLSPPARPGSWRAGNRCCSRYGATVASWKFAVVSPSSPCTRICMLIGTSPRNGTPAAAASFAAPPLPKMS